MPVVSLPDDLSEQLEESESGTINNTEGPGVAVYWSSDKRVRADIYIGFKLDGFKLYKNISAVHPEIKMEFALNPDICLSEVLTFNPDSDTVIDMQVVDSWILLSFIK